MADSAEEAKKVLIHTHTYTGTYTHTHTHVHRHGTKVVHWLPDKLK